MEESYGALVGGLLGWVQDNPQLSELGMGAIVAQLIYEMKMAKHAYAHDPAALPSALENLREKNPAVQLMLDQQTEVDKLRKKYGIGKL